VPGGIVLHDMTGIEAEQILDVPGSDIERGDSYWSPDGRRLTFLTRASGYCAAVVYRVSFAPPVPTLVLAATLGLERFEHMGVDGVVCDVFGPDWSPDGTE
jgi:Tol biopolymer transport system component